MTIHYLDVDDEVTTAVARLRLASEPHVALVLPSGSRVATSRINFRLLAREAAARERRLSIVAPETSVRAIAIAAGLPAYATVAAYEDALADELAQESRERTIGGGTSIGPMFSGPPRAGGSHATAGRHGDAPDRTARTAQGAGPSAPQVSTGPHVTTGDATGTHEAPPRATARGEPGSRAGSRSAGALPEVAHAHAGQPPRRRRRWLAALLVLVLLLVAAGGVGAYVLLPSAAITVTPVGQAAGPVELQVTADPTATSVDETHLVIPAQQVQIPLSAESTFPATGVKVDLKPAGGIVTFTSNDTIDPVTIPAGTTVATMAGVQFLTTATVVTPRATVNGTTISPGVASAPVQAVTRGPAGNVQAGSITVAPTRLQAFQVSVDNAAPTSGGARTETKVVSQQDYDAAARQLGTQIDTELQAAAAQPSTAPAGTTLVSGTAAHGAVFTAPGADALVGSARSTFQLTATASGTVLAVSQAPLTALASTRLRADVPAGWSLFEDSVRTAVSSPTVQDGLVIFSVRADGEEWRPLDASALLAQVKGKTVADARQLLSQYGEVSISTWPSFVGTIPTLDARVTLTVAPPKRMGQ